MCASIQDGLLVHRMECYYTGWCVSIWDEGSLVHAMGCSYTGWGVTIRDRVLVHEMGS